MTEVKGTRGYRLMVEQFVAAAEAIDFEELHQPYLDCLPRTPGNILDLGAGSGRDAAMFAGLGHSVTAVEPLEEFRNVARSLHDSPNIKWINDSLPDLQGLQGQAQLFDFVLASAVWHHLDPSEQEAAMIRVAELIQPAGFFALSLRHGPAGAGTHNFPTNPQLTVDTAENSGFKTRLALADQPSLVAGKPGVSWSKLVFQRL